MNRIYCLHDNILDLLKKKINNTDILTFDDGHYSVYKYRYILDDIDCKKILFVTPSYISMDRREEEPDMSIYYQWYYRVMNKSPWLNIYEIEDLIKNHNIELGMHSYYHDFVYVKGQNDEDRMWRMYKISKDINKMKILNRMYSIHSSLSVKGIDVLNGYLYYRNDTQFEEFIKSDTFMCVNWFKKYFGMPNKYAYPFFEGSPALDFELFKYGIKKDNIYGKRENIQNAVDKNDKIR